LISNVDIQALPARILVAPLNWGLGHASRCIPLIQTLVDAGKKVHIGSDGEALVFLKRAFPKLSFHALPSYDIEYKYASIEMSVLLQSTKMLSAIMQEKRSSTQIIEDENIELVISDNRYGVRSPHVKSIIITHQINLQSDNKLFSKSGTLINKRWIQKFDECWVPDYPGSKLSGVMSEGGLNIPKKFIGPLTRIYKTDDVLDYDVLAIVSGPEPKRSQFSEKLINLLTNKVYKSVIVHGKVKDEIIRTDKGKLTQYNFLDSEKLNRVINQSKIIICRSGFSSIMDLCDMNKKVILVPTEGQTEQVYLSEFLKGQYGFSTLNQNASEKDFEELIKALL